MRTLYTTLLRQMGTCTGALTSALQKLAIDHANTRFVTELQMLALENKTLQSAPDAVCTRGL